MSATGCCLHSTCEPTLIQCTLHVGTHPCGILQLLKGVAVGIVTESLAVKLKTDFFLCSSSFALHGESHMQMKKLAVTAEELSSLPGPFVAIQLWPSCLQMCLAAPALAHVFSCAVHAGNGGSVSNETLQWVASRQSAQALKAVKLLTRTDQ